MSGLQLVLHYRGVPAAGIQDSIAPSLQQPQPSN